jgi:hypothetical protein
MRSELIAITKQTKRKTIVISITSIVTIMAVIIVPIFSNDLRRPPAIIRERLLLEVPLGSTEEVVVEFILRHEDWHLWRGGYPFERARRVTMGTYMCILRVDVAAFWVFDEDGYLIELVIRKYVDVL